ncbi:hypothetical protein [Streptomyces sp. NPDC018693]|uniref:hypothetical protein n=1 Tax=unclassified Streptomyces TaxID=2593676 RepID=UPI003789CEF9
MSTPTRIGAFGLLDSAKHGNDGSPKAAPDYPRAPHPKQVEDHTPADPKHLTTSLDTLVADHERRPA